MELYFDELPRNFSMQAYDGCELCNEKGLNLFPVTLVTNACYQVEMGRILDSTSRYRYTGTVHFAIYKIRPESGEDFLGYIELPIKAQTILQVEQFLKWNFHKIRKEYPSGNYYIFPELDYVVDHRGNSDLMKELFWRI